MKMFVQQVSSILLFSILCTLGFDEMIFVNGEGQLLKSKEMLEKGRKQYEVLQERKRLPHYGPCWTQAVEHLEETCADLSEDTQSDVALHMANCFLAMSGHDTYNCVMDRKPNLRAICINSMSDRAFSVYIEFYTHTQNICWFLRGQLWQEMMQENTKLVGNQLKASAKTQKELLRNQEESLKVQEKIMKYGSEMESILGSFISSAREHQEIIRVLSETVGNLQSWLMGEISWIDSILFYVSAAFLVFFLTSTPKTFAARLPILGLLTLNLFLERLLCRSMDANVNVDIKIVHRTYQSYVWYLRYTFVVLALGLLIYTFVYFKDYLVANNLILEELKEEVRGINCKLRAQKDGKALQMDLHYIRECSGERSGQNSECSDISLMSPHFESSALRKDRKRRTPLSDLQARYNLRSRQGTPDSNI